MKLFLLVFCTLLKSYFLYVLPGIVNRLFRIFESIFIVYPGNEAYLKAYCFKFSEEWFRWWPNPVGVFKQGGKWGIVFAAPVFESQFISSKNRSKFKKLKLRIDRIAKILGIKKINYAGILPSFLEKLDMLGSDIQNEKPALIVHKAYKTLSQQKYNRLIPVILLGGDGSLGKYIQVHLKTEKIKYYIVDLSRGTSSLPKSLAGKPTILIDVARKGVVENYIDQFWQELILLNETYPEPSKKLLNRLKDLRNEVFHISGVEGRCYPKLINGYADTVPCCAIHTDIDNINPVVKKMI